MASAALKQVVLFGVLVQLCTVLCTEVTFRGREYIAYGLQSQHRGSRSNNIQLKFKTIYPTGILVYSRGSQGDFVHLELIDGTLRFNYFLGGAHTSTMTAGKELADGQWHTVSVRRTGRKTELTLDGSSNTQLARGDFKELNLDDFIYIGGLGSNRRRYFLNDGARGFRGCMKNVNFDNIPILDQARAKARNFQVHGTITYQCLMERYEPVTFNAPDSFVKLTVPKLSQDNNTFSTSFKFRTFHKEGVLVSRRAIKVKTYLRLDAGSLLYDITANGAKTVLKLGNDLDDGDWHEVNATIHASGAKVTLDGRPKETKLLNQSTLMLEFANKSRLKIFAGRGGPQDRYYGFVGCLLDLKIDSHKIKKKEFRQAEFSRGIYSGKCMTINRCYPNPCKNDGKCFQDYKSYYCDCSSMEFVGLNCEDSIYKQTCKEYRQMGLKKDAFCLMGGDKRGKPKTYTALCNVTDADRSYTVIKHMKMGRTLVGDAAIKFELYDHEIIYQAKMEQIKALIDSSKECRQYIRYDCLRGKLLNSPKNKSFVFWWSRDQNVQTHWGGATPGSYMCACGMTRTCKSPARHCNCDSRADMWRFDDGYLTSKDLLPVTKIQFRQRVADSYITLGPLECWGTTKQGVTTSGKHLIDRVCSAVIEPTTPTGATPTKRKDETEKRTKCIFDGVAYNCHSGSVPRPTSSTPREDTRISTKTTPTKPTTISNVDAFPIRNPSSRSKQLSTAAVVLISLAVIVVLLLMVKFLFPRIVLCIRTHSKRGEYIVPPVGPQGYPGRLMPYVTGKKSQRKRLSYRGYHEKQMEGVSSSGTASYWV